MHSSTQFKTQFSWIKIKTPFSEKHKKGVRIKALWIQAYTQEGVRKWGSHFLTRVVVTQENHAGTSECQTLFFHIFSELVQALVITHDEIFQALAVEGFVPLPKPLLDLGFDCVVPWKSPASEMFFQLAKNLEVQGNGVGAVRWVGWGPEVASGAGQTFLPPGLGKSHRVLWRIPEQVCETTWKNRRLIPKDTHVFFGSSYFNSCKKIREPYFLISSRIKKNFFYIYLFVIYLTIMSVARIT
jgi:hypothetical protein